MNGDLELLEQAYDQYQNQIALIRAEGQTEIDNLLGDLADQVRAIHARVEADIEAVRLEGQPIELQLRERVLSQGETWKGQRWTVQYVHGSLKIKDQPGFLRLAKKNPSVMKLVEFGKDYTKIVAK